MVCCYFQHFTCCDQNILHLSVGLNFVYHPLPNIFRSPKMFSIRCGCVRFVVLFGFLDYRQCCDFWSGCVFLIAHVDTVYLDLFIALSAYNRFCDRSKFDMISWSVFMLYTKHLLVHRWSCLLASDVPAGAPLRCWAKVEVKDGRSAGLSCYTILHVIRPVLF